MPPHTHYVEPYFGGGAVLLAKDPEGVSEVVCDINLDLSNFWCVLQRPEAFERFKREVEAIPFSERQWDSAAEVGGTKIQETGPWSDVADAVAFFIRVRQSRQGLGKDFATLSRNRTRRGMNEQASAWWTAVEGLADFHARLQRVVILKGPAVKVIKQQDGPNTCHYCDPTYLHDTRVTTNDYQHEMTRQDHVELLETLETIEGKFLLSGYRSELYDEWAERNGFKRHDFLIDNKASGKAIKDIKTECVWTNYT